MINTNYSLDSYYNYNNQIALNKMNNPVTLEDRKNINEAVRETRLENTIQSQKREDQKIESNKEYAIKEQNVQQSRNENVQSQNRVSERKSIEEKNNKIFEELQREQKDNMISKNKYRNNSYYVKGSIISDYA